MCVYIFEALKTFITQSKKPLHRVRHSPCPQLLQTPSRQQGRGAKEATFKGGLDVVIRNVLSICRINGMNSSTHEGYEVRAP